MCLGLSPALSGLALQIFPDQFALGISPPDDRNVIRVVKFRIVSAQIGNHLLVVFVAACSYVCRAQIHQRTVVHGNDLNHHCPRLNVTAQHCHPGLIIPLAFANGRGLPSGNNILARPFVGRYQKRLKSWFQGFFS